MKTLTSSNNKPAANLDKAIERENWHKIVVKIISWKNGLADGGSIDSNNKITAKEWKAYCQGVLKNHITEGEKETKRRLKETKALIEKFGGFK